LLEIDRTQHAHADTRALSKQILEAFGKLDEPQKISYQSLHSYASPDFRKAAERELNQPWDDLPALSRKVLGIYAANAWGNMVFGLPSRINHSCIPNMVHTDNLRKGKGVFHAIRDIAAGEELTLTYNYGKVHCTRAQRQADLKATWGFTCSCPACSDTAFGQENAERRARMFDLDQKAHHHLNKYEWELALEPLQELAALQESEGIVTLELASSYVYH
jgi:hypothetical protein